MKKYHLYLWIVALVGLMTACSQDEAAGPQNEASSRVRIGTSINQALQTRAASVNIPANHKLRYVLEVWSTTEFPACIHRAEETATTAGAVTFDFTLADVGNYKALLWADFVSASAATSTENTPNTYTHYADLHYMTTNNLKAVELLKANTGYVINDEARDAFFACITIQKETGAFEKSVELTRPFGQINVIEKNDDLLAKVATMTLEYNVPNKFDVATGAPSGTTVAVKPTVSTLPTATAARKANLFYDFIFAPATTSQTTLGEMKLKFTSSDQTVTLDNFTIPANMPAVRNKRTNISGSILHTSTVPSGSAKLSVTVSDNWEETTDGDYDVDALVWDGTTISKPADYNSGSPGEVSITTAAELAWLAKQQNIFRGYTFKLTADIDLNNREWTPIGSTYTFNGNFDGQGHTVSNLKCTNSREGGLFAKIMNATVKNVTVSGSVSFNTDNYACQLGGIVAHVLDNSTITDCTNQCAITATGSGNRCDVGGIAGYVHNQSSNYTFIISSNTNTGNVSGNGKTSSYAGGIIGTATTSNSSSITLTGNRYNGGTPSNVCIGYCLMNSGTITIDETEATTQKPYPIPQS